MQALLGTYTFLTFRKGLRNNAQTGTGQHLNRFPVLFTHFLDYRTGVVAVYVNRAEDNIRPPYPVLKRFFASLYVTVMVFKYSPILFNQLAVNGFHPVYTTYDQDSFPAKIE